MKSAALLATVATLALTAGAHAQTLAGSGNGVGLLGVQPDDAAPDKSDAGVLTASRTAWRDSDRPYRADVMQAYDGRSPARIVKVAQSGSGSGGVLGSGNGGGLLGGRNGGSGASADSASQQSSGYRDNSGDHGRTGQQTRANSGTTWHDNRSELRDTTVGGVSLDPTVSLSNTRGVGVSVVDSRATSSGGAGQAGGASQSSQDQSGSGVAVSVPVAVQPTTLGGFSRQRAGGASYDRGRSSGFSHSAANREASGQSSTASNANASSRSR